MEKLHRNWIIRRPSYDFNLQEKKPVREKKWSCLKEDWGSIGSKTILWVLLMGSMMLVASGFYRSSVQVLNLENGGHVVVLDEVNGQEVMCYDWDGELNSNSWFHYGNGTYWEYVRLFRRAQAALRSEDIPALSLCMNYPVRINSSKEKFWYLENPRDLVLHYDRIFDDGTTCQILQADAKDVFNRRREAMFGDGVVWARKIPAGPIGITVINQWEGSSIGECGAKDLDDE